MSLEELLQKANSVCDDSRYASKGALFFCKGEHFKKEYLESAIKKGIIGYVSCVDYGFDVPHIIVDDIRYTMAEAAKEFFGNPSSKLSLIGITGTKGKSTTLYYLKNIMEVSDSCGEGSFGYISTIDNYDGKKIVESHLTTPEIFELNTLLFNMAENGIKKAGMEVSSQGLKYGRVKNIHYLCGAFENFSLDHIGPGEHDDEDDYFNSKLSLVDHCDNFIVNLDDSKADIVINRCLDRQREGKLKDIYTISLNGKTAKDCIAINASNIRKENGLTKFELDSFGEISLRMPGLFNVYNAAFAAVFARMLGAGNDDVKKGLLDAKAAGRMEIYKNENEDIIGIVDFAHNKISFEKIFESVAKEYEGYTINAVFGCPGNKAPERRIELPLVAAKYSDYSYITEDDPFNEDPNDICKTVYDNLISFGGKGEIVVDRKEAIKKAIKNAKAHTIILFLAKGCDKYMHRIDFDKYESDSVLVNEEIKNI